MTLQLLPLERERGIGPVLSSTLRAAQSFASRVGSSRELVLLRKPTLDIVNYYPAAERASDGDRLARAGFKQLMESEPPVYLGLVKGASGWLRDVHPEGRCV